MINVLGQDMEATQAFLQENPTAHPHFYGKLEAKHNRKMGHVTVFSDELDEMREF
jgi:5-(carboxyamino)imidazole ribonucleotide synthase